MVHRPHRGRDHGPADWCSAGEEVTAVHSSLKKCVFCDESGIRSDYHSGTTWAAVGQTPVVKSSGSRFSLNMVLAISAKGSLRFMVVAGRGNGERFMAFLKRLIHNAGRPIFLVVDGYPSHRAKIVTQFVESTEGRLQLFFLPGYSPKLNPDELVWKYVKHQRLVGRPEDLSIE